MNVDNITYFDSFGLKIFQKRFKKNHRRRKYHNKYFQNTSIQFNNVWILLIEFINFVLKSERILYYASIFSPNKYENNWKKHFQYIL